MPTATVLDRFRLDDKVAVVTGASSGLGVAFAKALAEAGGGAGHDSHLVVESETIENGRRHGLQSPG